MTLLVCEFVYSDLVSCAVSSFFGFCLGAQRKHSCRRWREELMVGLMG